MYNLTFFEVSPKEGMCNLWDETEEDRGPNEIATLISHYIESAKSFSKSVVVSDVCGRQNKNKFFTSLYLMLFEMCHTMNKLNTVVLLLLGQY